MLIMKPLLPTFLLSFTAVACLVFNGCEYEVPITAQPTGKIEEKLLGNWAFKGKDGEQDKKDKMKVVRLDESHYIVSYDGDLFRAHHSDMAKTPFLSIQELESKERHYTYATWKLSADGQQLGLRIVSSEVIPKDIKDSAAMQKLLEKNLKNTNLFGEEAVFTKEK